LAILISILTWRLAGCFSLKYVGKGTPQQKQENYQQLQSPSQKSTVCWPADSASEMENGSERINKKQSLVVKIIKLFFDLFICE
jgi:hypothetical protein